MGDPKKQRKKYETPRHPWRSAQIQDELKLIGDYGLRNKRELWRYKTEISRIRGIARSLLAKTEEARSKAENDLLLRLKRSGILSEDATLDDVLDLNVTNLLERRLQTVVARSGMAKSMHHARQLVSHGHVFVGGRAVTVPGYMVRSDQKPEVRLDAPAAAEAGGSSRKGK
jgi:small subunit ribosomal protein S4